MPTKKNKSTPQDEGAVRMDGASDNKLVSGPRWLNPKEALPKELREPPKPKEKPTILDDARAVVVGVSPTGVSSDRVLSAVIIAQALDRLSAATLDAAAIGRPNIVIERD